MSSTEKSPVMATVGAYLDASVALSEGQDIGSRSIDEQVAAALVTNWIECLPSQFEDVLEAILFLHASQKPAIEALKYTRRAYKRFLEMEHSENV